MSERATWSVTTHDWSQDVDREHLAHVRRHAQRYGSGGRRHLVLEVLAYANDEAEALGRIGLAVVTTDDDAMVTVRDDGRGTADADRGSGLTGLQDRVEALGGAIRLHSPPGAGTTLEAHIPLGQSPSRDLLRHSQPELAHRGGAAAGGRDHRGGQDPAQFDIPGGVRPLCTFQVRKSNWWPVADSRASR